MKNLLVSALFIIVLASCKPNASTEEVQQSSEVDIKRTQDSINKVKQDSIDAVNKKIVEEFIERKRIDATEAIDKFTRGYMTIVSPLSGENPSYEIIDAESEYIPETKAVKFVFIARWQGVAVYLDDKIETHESKGRFTYYSDGEVKYEELEQNSVLKIAIEASNGMARLNSLMEALNTNQ